MPKHIIKNTTEDSVEWELVLNSDGDVVLEANGEEVAYIDSETDKFTIFHSDLVELGLSLRVIGEE